MEYIHSKEHIFGDQIEGSVTSYKSFQVVIFFAFDLMLFSNSGVTVSLLLKVSHVEVLWLSSLQCKSVQVKKMFFLQIDFDINKLWIIEDLEYFS